MTLTDFLLARITEDEAAARRVGAFEDAVPWLRPAPGWSPPPARVLAECEAKRRLVERLGPVAHEVQVAWDLAEEALKILALPYADHEDYREEWRP